VGLSGIDVFEISLLFIVGIWSVTLEMERKNGENKAAEVFGM